MSAIRDISAWTLGATSGNLVAPPSGGTGTVLTGENISGPVAVCFNQSGQMIVAMASVSGRWPAVGISTQNTLSGLPAAWSQTGTVQYTSGMVDFSGFLNRRVWLGRSGQLCAISGNWASGGWASGDIGQAIGIAANSGGIVIQIGTFWSGGPNGLNPAMIA